MSDQALELTPEELNVAVTKEAGYYVEQEPSSAIVETYWWLHKPNGEFVIERFDERIHTYARTAEEAWAQAPNFSGSLDACEILKQQIFKHGLLNIERGGGYCEVTICLQESKNICVVTGGPYAEPTALCRAYRKFKELITK